MNLSKGYLLALVATLGVLTMLLVAPFLQYVLGAILLAYILYPVQERLEERLDERVSALVLVVLALAGFILPFALVLTTIAGDAIDILETAQETEILWIDDAEQFIEAHTGVQVSIVENIQRTIQNLDLGQLSTLVLNRTTDVISVFAHTLLGIGLALFLIYYFLKDGHQLVAWLEETTPLPADVQADLYTEIDDVLRAALLGHVFVAFVQGVVAGLGLYATGVPNATFWTFMMVILAILPLIGAFMVWGPASVYLALTGEPVSGIALFVYGTIVVGLTDDYLRPIVVDRHAELNPGVIILGVLGGVYAFGVMGLFFGPVILGAFKATLGIVTEHYHQLEHGPANA